MFDNDIHIRHTYHYANSNVDNIYYCLNEALAYVFNWLQANKLTLATSQQTYTEYVWAEAEHFQLLKELGWMVLKWAKSQSQKKIVFVIEAIKRVKHPIHK